MRENGFREDGRLSLNAHQIGATSVYAGLVVRAHSLVVDPNVSAPSATVLTTPSSPRTTQFGFYYLQTPAIGDDAARLTLQIVYALVSLLVVSAFVKAAGTDPVDDTRKQVGPRETALVLVDHRASSLVRLTSSSSPSPPQDPPNPEALFCNLCACDVAKGSKHCRACDKCVLHFDHHCKWLNNCVGAKNYHSFFVLVVAVLVQVLAQLAAGGFLLHWALTDKRGANERLAADPYPTALNQQEFVAAVLFYLFAGACLCYLVGDLFAFHVLLIRRGITTYDYITARIEQNDDLGSIHGEGGGGADVKGGVPCGRVAKGRVAPHGASRRRVRVSCLELLRADVRAGERRDDDRENVDVERGTNPPSRSNENENDRPRGFNRFREGGGGGAPSTSSTSSRDIDVRYDDEDGDGDGDGVERGGNIAGKVTQMRVGGGGLAPLPVRPASAWRANAGVGGAGGDPEPVPVGARAGRRETT
jgi:hypothetical protein